MKPLVSEETILGVYHETLEALYAYVSRRADGDRGIAEDVVQETWLRAVAAWPAQGLPSKPIAWLKTVARNVLLNRRRMPEPVSLDGLPRVDSDQGLGVRDVEPFGRGLGRVRHLGATAAVRGARHDHGADSLERHHAHRRGRLV